MPCIVSAGLDSFLIHSLTHVFIHSTEREAALVKPVTVLPSWNFWPGVGVGKLMRLQAHLGSQEGFLKDVASDPRLARWERQERVFQARGVAHAKALWRREEAH
jgi:hypothetical protein